MKTRHSDYQEKQFTRQIYQVIYQIFSYHIKMKFLQQQAFNIE